MKKTKLVLVAVVLLLIPAVALGGLNKGEKEVVISKTTVHSGDFVNGAATVDVSGTVEGDVMTAGAQVDISGTVEGDILSAGGQVDISGCGTRRPFGWWKCFLFGNHQTKFQRFRRECSSVY